MTIYIGLPLESIATVSCYKYIQEEGLDKIPVSVCAAFLTIGCKERKFAVHLELSFDVLTITSLYISAIASKLVQAWWLEYMSMYSGNNYNKKEQCIAYPEEAM